MYENNPNNLGNPNSADTSMAKFPVLPDQRSEVIKAILNNKGPQYQLLRKQPDSGYYYDSNHQLLNGFYVFVSLDDPDEGHSIVQRISLRPASNGINSHCMLLDNLDMLVLFAGELYFINGNIISWNNRSGSFRIKPEYANQAGLSLEKFIAV
jgi:hypothetical protein